MTKRRHHYLPQFYLRNFADPNDEKVWIYTKQGEMLNGASPRDIGVEKDYHTVTRRDGIKDRHTIEDTVGALENIAAPVVQKIIRGTAITFDDHRSFVVFVAQMLLRVPARRDEMGKMLAGVLKKISRTFASDKEFYHASYRRFRQETGDTSTVDPEDVRQFILSDDCELDANPTAALGLNLGALGVVVKCLLLMNWVFVRANGRFKFITCDNPVFFWDPTIGRHTWHGVGLMNPGVEVIFPVSPDITAFGTHRAVPQASIEVTPEIVRQFNQHMVDSAQRHIFACEDSSALERFISRRSQISRVRS
jgi:Protein of unknown function (DUF4238)